ncbi:hypothetical protein [Paenibacillus abyssi]|uniref:Uncharacterized protein n=1 Tax=Paenibacillus abyssi TaxID=1340531 RepID=A0A917CSK0_9BACL|nr:hypothetical protein [Paenibacillus abyssi]GGF98138.1 hypothetical protein GCM10010916_14210 [Paenibacillus abyssi]
MVRIRYQDIHIESLSKSSGIYSGSNIQWKFKHIAKQNQAFGTVNGKACSISNVRASLNDNDQYDLLFMRKILNP